MISEIIWNNSTGVNIIHLLIVRVQMISRKFPQICSHSYRAIMANISILSVFCEFTLNWHELVKDYIIIHIIFESSSEKSVHHEKHHFCFVWYVVCWELINFHHFIFFCFNLNFITSSHLFGHFGLCKCPRRPIRLRIQLPE